MHWFVSEDKKFDQDQKVDRKSVRCLYEHPMIRLTVMYTRFESSVIIMGILSNGCYIIPPKFFRNVLWFNASGDPG